MQINTAEIEADRVHTAMRAAHTTEATGPVLGKPMERMTQRLKECVPAMTMAARSD